MKRYLLILAQCLIIIMTLSCNAMEKNFPQPIVEETGLLKELTTVEAPNQINCFPDNIAVIAAKKSCSIINLNTGTEIKRIETPKCGFIPFITANPDTKIVSLICPNGRKSSNLIAYNIITKETWEKKLDIRFPTSCYRPVFNPINDTFLIQKYINPQAIIVFDYKKNTLDPLGQSFNLQLNQFHPTQHNLCLACNSKEICILHFDKASNSFNRETNLPLQTLKTCGDIERTCYSFDGSLIAALTTRKICYIINPQSNSETPLHEQRTYHTWSMAFNPINFVLATLSINPYVICYWNAKTYQLITTIPLSGTAQAQLLGGNRIDFSYDGKKLVAALNDKCIVFDSPEIIADNAYRPGTKDKCIAALWAVQNLNNNEVMLPKEVIHLPIYALLELLQY